MTALVGTCEFTEEQAGLVIVHPSFCFLWGARARTCTPPCDRPAEELPPCPRGAWAVPLAAGSKAAARGGSSSRACRAAAALGPTPVRPQPSSGPGCRAPWPTGFGPGGPSGPSSPEGSGCPLPSGRRRTRSRASPASGPGCRPASGRGSGTPPPFRPRSPGTCTKGNKNALITCSNRRCVPLPSP